MKFLKLIPFAALLGVVFLAQPASAQPVEYVRVCDTFGTGWFYIPGTEQCLGRIPARSGSRPRTV